MRHLLQLALGIAFGRRGRLRTRGTLGLGLFGKVASLAELDAKRVGERGFEGGHGPHALGSHFLGGQHEIFTGNAELLGQLDDFYLCRCHRPLTSWEPISSSFRQLHMAS